MLAFADRTEEQMRQRLRNRTGPRALVLWLSFILYSGFEDSASERALEPANFLCWLAVIACQLPFESSLRRSSHWNVPLGYFAYLAPVACHAGLLMHILLFDLHLRDSHQGLGFWPNVVFCVFLVWYCVAQPFLQLGMLRMAQKELAVVHEARLQHLQPSNEQP